MIVLRVKEAKHSKRETVCKYLDSFEALSLVVDKPWRCILIWTSFNASSPGASTLNKLSSGHDVSLRIMAFLSSADALNDILSLSDCSHRALPKKLYFPLVRL